MQFFRAFGLMGMLVFATGCATIVGDTDQTVTINSSPSEASVTVTDERNMEVYSGETPATVRLRKSDGSYFGGKTYTVDLARDGYQSRSIKIESRPNGWFLAGNLAFGGLIGWFVIDPLSGAMYNLSPDEISASLGEQAASGAAGELELTLVLMEDVPKALRPKLSYLGRF